MDKERKWKKIGDGIKICKITTGEELVRKVLEECYGNGKTRRKWSTSFFFFLGVKAIRSGAGEMKEEKWRATRGERKGCSEGRGTESVARSR